MRGKKLLFGFGIFLILTLAIGGIGITQIYSLNKAIQELGKSELGREMTILEMKINNALYATGVRNYAFWRTSRYVDSPAASPSSDSSLIEKSAATFRNYLAMYENLAASLEQKKWAGELKVSLEELQEMGKKITSLADKGGQDKEKINLLLMAFENRSYRISDFLAENLSKDNLKRIEKQLNLARDKERASIILLLISLLASLALGITITYIVYTGLERERRRRELVVQKMIRIEEEERRNLSGQVHDQLSQDLSALKIFLELIEERITPQEAEARDKIEKCRKILAGLIEKSHDISRLLRPPELDEIGLLESISGLILEHKEITGCNYNYQKPASEIKLPAEHSLLIYRVVQESLTNIVKHAQAKNISISFEKTAGSVNLEISDDGLGFNYHNFLRYPRRRREDQLKMGLQGLKERVGLLGGKLSVDSALGKGTRIRVELPCL